MGKALLIIIGSMIIFISCTTTQTIEPENLSQFANRPVREIKLPSRIHSLELRNGDTVLFNKDGAKYFPKHTDKIEGITHQGEEFQGGIFDSKNIILFYFNLCLDC